VDGAGVAVEPTQTGFMLGTVGGVATPYVVGKRKASGAMGGSKCAQGRQAPIDGV
jgi:hypothetical protein